MKRMLLSWYANYRLYGLAGALLWAFVAAAAWQYARVQGLPFLPTMVTWDEWTVAVLLLPRLWTFVLTGFSMMTRGSRVTTAMQNVMYGGSTQAVADQFAEDVAYESKVGGMGWGARLAATAAAVFALDLVVRAACGLGWQSFV